MESMKGLVERTLAPQLLKILDDNKSFYSKQNLSEAERNTFLATKAKSAGMSAAQLEAILNSGFFYVPFIEQYRHATRRMEVEEKDTKGTMHKYPATEYTHDLKLGLLWYRLAIDRNNAASLVFVGAARGWQDGAITRSAIHRDDAEGTGAGRDVEAFESAVNASCQNIALETKKIEAFRLVGEVTETTFMGVKVSLGTKEGVGVDDSYWVEELQETESGQVIRAKRGFIKIREIGDNKRDESAVSYGQTIIGSDYSAGLMVTEIPMLGMNAVLGGIVSPAKLSLFDNGSYLTRTGNHTTLNGFYPANEYDFGVKINSETKSAYGAALDVQSDLANKTRIPEFWLSLGGGYSVLSVDGNFFFNKYSTSGTKTGVDSADISFGSSYYGRLGLLKKFYLKRFGFFIQADAKLTFVHLTATGKDDKNDKDMDYKLKAMNFGLYLRTGVEVYLNPMLSLGAGVEYNIFGASTSWTATITDSDKNDKKSDSVDGPELNHSGLGISVWVNYALPSLN
ncbi:MAG: hypothetical protein NTV54_01670 [Ignavibacteriales bacterium]|nr:hypothetical protein [Ignavibacteriales bacterium]